MITLALAPALAAGKCEPQGGGQQKACNLWESQPPKWQASNGRGKGLVVASVKAACDSPPKRHSLTVWLEREGSDGKSWFQVGEPAVYDGAANMPPPSGRSYPVQVICVDGQWRVRARAEGVSPDGAPFKFALPAAESHISVVRCRIQ